MSGKFKGSYRQIIEERGKSCKIHRIGCTEDLSYTKTQPNKYYIDISDKNIKGLFLFFLLCSFSHC
jgi:hypothetical protein